MSVKKLDFMIIGGDIRQYKLYKQLIAEGINVMFVGLHSDNPSSKCKAVQNIIVSDYNKLFGLADVIIGPIPCSKDKETIFALSGEKIYIDNLFKSMKKDSMFIAGMIPESVRQKALSCNIKIIDILERDEMAIMNAIPTAEGALQIAMEQSEITIHNSKCLVLGYGHCGKAIAKILKGLGADVSVSYRNEGDAAIICSNNLNAIKLSELSLHLSCFDFIFNTIPALVLNKKLLSLINSKTIIIDIAQAPGGLDYTYAKKENIKSLFCPGLPGIVAPETAAKIIRKTVFNILEEGDVKMG